MNVEEVTHGGRMNSSNLNIIPNSLVEIVQKR